MSCCKPETITKLAFLEAKSVNFIKYVNSFEPDEEVKGYIISFKPELLAHTIQTVVIPIISLGQLDHTVEELLSHLTVPDTSKPEVMTKLKAYLQMFNDVLLG